MEESIYEQSPGFPYCFEFEGSLYFTKEDTVAKLKEMGIKLWKRRNYE